MTNMIYTAMPALPKKHHTNAVVLPSEWNTCPLSSIVEEISETVGTRKIETISISAGIGFVNQAEKFGRELSGKQYEQYIVLHKGDFSYNKGNSNMYPQGCIYRLNNRTEAAVPNVFESFRVSVGNPDYYEQLFLSGFLNRQLYSKINRGVRDNGLLNLKGKDFYSCEVPYPPLAEQERIAEILIQCDHVIELKEQKLDELKQLKKEFLRKMFPAKGCDTPEIRFPGFTGAWEQRKVGDYYEFKNGLNKGKEFFGEGTPIVNFTDVFHNRGISPEMLSGKVRLKLSEIKNYEVKKGDIFFTRTSETIEEIGYPSVMLGEPENTVFSGFVLRGRCFLKDDPLDILFKKYIFFTDAFRTEMIRKSSMTTRALTSGTAIKNMEFIHPSLKEEQYKIGEILTKFDNLITLHQRELEETKTYKKTLAKLLLTGIVRVQG